MTTPRRQARAVLPKQRGKRTQFAYGVPACTTVAAYTTWRESVRGTGLGHAGFCEDCTVAYQATHIKLKTCENQRVVFHTDSDGFNTGVLL